MMLRNWPAASICKRGAPALKSLPNKPIIKIGNRSITARNGIPNMHMILMDVVANC